MDKNTDRARGVALDMAYGAPLPPTVDVVSGDHAQLTGTDLVVVTADANEHTGGATDRSDPGGRLRLLGTNAAVYRDVVPRIVEHAPDAVVMVVTNPPDPLADLTRESKDTTACSRPAPSSTACVSSPRTTPTTVWRCPWSACWADTVSSGCTTPA
ncbi:hypothetical protein [Nonomuraea sp. NPDC005650]|uniref:lactate/malate family dehydrogenase n=1 Tax=Nonomuraea sp. NPDC005650 TaxID=3157045 RepID=UPI0033A5399F